MLFDFLVWPLCSYRRWVCTYLGLTSCRSRKRKSRTRCEFTASSSLGPTEDGDRGTSFWSRWSFKYTFGESEDIVVSSCWLALTAQQSFPIAPILNGFKLRPSLVTDFSAALEEPTHKFSANFPVDLNLNHLHIIVNKLYEPHTFPFLCFHSPP